MKSLEGKPFALVGVNGWGHKPGDLAALMKKEDLNWRSFDAGNEVAREWSLPPTPSYFVIDHQGVIRRNWIGNPGQKAIDAALEALIKEAERASAGAGRK